MMMESHPTLSEVRDFWNTRPCNIRHSNSEIGSIQYFNEVEARKYLVEPHIPIFADFSAWQGKNVLEVGCGIGTDAVNFVRNGANYTGVELSVESLNLAKKRFEVFGLTGRLVEGNAEELDTIFSGEKFDLIYSFGVLHHTPSLSKSLSSISKLMDKNSTLRMMVYAKHSWKNAMIEGGLDQPEAQSGCPIANTYSKEEITKFLNETGFEVMSIDQDHIFPYRIEEYKKYRYVREAWFEMMPEQVFRSLEKSLGWHLLVVARLG
jgi:ubiquinone/menaquinone biosynthesis C-methylase UbiE